ncbi:MAG TPA: mannose-6-phosphate isomerase, class I, partial [Flavisolibacter sp.]|nr:mannose-6-phosphate isomerase, class I [Flavisolibacter sp.]
MQKVFKINGVVQHYSWGGYEYIPSLLGIENKEQKPFAEYWLGAHPNHPSIITGSSKNVHEYLQENSEALLGKRVAQQFSSLPYLFKVLDVRQMLSIQVHPNKVSAEKGFDEENKKDIPVSAANRNYKDKNHKPEMMIALGDFWLLHGFKSEAAIIETIDSIPEFSFLRNVFNTRGYKGLYEAVMNLPQEKVDEILAPVMNRILPDFESGALDKNNPNYWAAKAVINFCKNESYDRGIFSIYFFNLLHLKKGEGIFQPAGLPHAYLEGQNIEVMANSDNVLRAGLTDKHIDVKELNKHVVFEETIPNIYSPSGATVEKFETPASEFA